MGEEYEQTPPPKHMILEGRQGKEGDGGENDQVVLRVYTNPPK